MRVAWGLLLRNLFHALEVGALTDINLKELGIAKLKYCRQGLSEAAMPQLGRPILTTVRAQASPS
jgi:hypothetical protein